MDRLTACNGGPCYGIGYGETPWWYEDTSTDSLFADDEYPWVERSGNVGIGSVAGAFYSGTDYGYASINRSFRSVLVVSGA